MLKQLGLAVVTATGMLIDGSFHGQVASGMEFTLQLDLDSASSDANRFGARLMIDTLSSLGIMNEETVVEMSGAIGATLGLDYDPHTGEGRATSIEFIDLRPPISGAGQGVVQEVQSASGLQVIQTMETRLDVPTGQVAFLTQAMTGYVATANGSTPVAEQQFSLQNLNVFQDQGVAVVRPPTKPPTRQMLDKHPIHGKISTAGALGIIDVSHAMSNARTGRLQVDLEIPMQGLTMQVEQVGLPVTLLILDGVLRASGVVTIPEPTALLLTWCAVALACGARRLSPRR